MPYHRTQSLYQRLEEETGQATGFAPVGFIEVACEPDRLEEYRRVAAFNRLHGVDVHEIDAAEVASLFPLAETSDVLAGFYVEVRGDAESRPTPEFPRFPRCAWLAVDSTETWRLLDRRRG